jgi:ElaA protein
MAAASGASIPIEWRESAFDELSVHDLYDVLYLRAATFVVEQRSLTMDLDYQDIHARHLLGVVDGIVMAYARLSAPGEVFAGASVDRLVTALPCRRTGVGRLLLREAILAIEGNWGSTEIHVCAPLHLIGFFESFGFSRDAGYEPTAGDGGSGVYLVRPAGDNTEALSLGHDGS